MKVTDPVDLFIADKLFQLATRTVPATDRRSSTRRCAGKTVLVLGGSYGIGAEIARAGRRRHGANVVAFRPLDDRHPRRGRRAQLAAAFTGAYEDSGGSTPSCSRRRVLRVGRSPTCPRTRSPRRSQVNYLAAVHVARAAYRYLAETGGHLLYFTSSSYTRGRENYALYSSTKAAIVNLTQALSDEWSPQGIKVNVVNPERTATPMRSRAFGEEPEGSLLSAVAVARSSLDVLVSDATGLVVDVRRESAGAPSPAHDAERVAAAVEVEQGELEAESRADYVPPVR